MLDKILNLLRKYCGYYDLEKRRNFYKTAYYDCLDDFKRLAGYTEKLEAKQETKILENDILSAKLESKILEYDILENKNKELHIEYKKYLINQLEEILNIMKNKGTHPQDLINFMINKYKRDIK